MYQLYQSGNIPVFYAIDSDPPIQQSEAVMLRATFQHIAGISKKTEHALWKKGITSWEKYNKNTDQQLSFFDDGATDCRLNAGIRAYEQGDMKFFAEQLPSSLLYRVALTYPRETIFLDIETTGLSLYYDQLTIAGWSLGKKYGLYIQGQDDSAFRNALKEAKAIVTFNGTLFDLKFIKKTFEDIELPPVHIDLRYFAKRAGLSGGQKSIEAELGFHRTESIEGIQGEAAPVLWHLYRRGDKDALKQLIIYNHADVEGMKWIFDHAVQRFYDIDFVPTKVQSKVKFWNLNCEIDWAKRRPGKQNPYKVYVEPFTGNVKPLITYKQLTDITNLDNFTAIGIDLVSSDDRETGYCILKGSRAETCRIKTDDEMIQLAIDSGADIISIDSPLSIPEGRTSFFDDDPYRQEFGITRLCERILKKRGINSYPCLIQSMQKLTRRGMLLAEKFRKKGIPVIESYPGAAQDIMSIPRKQSGLQHLTVGLSEFGITGAFVDQPVSHDELDAITSAIVGHFFWTGMYEGLGNNKEEYLIIPDLNANTDTWHARRVIGLSGSIAAGKSTAARYLKGRDWLPLRYSQVLEKKLLAEGKEADRSNLQQLGRQINEEGKQRQLGKELTNLIPLSQQQVVIDGLRFPEDRALLIETFGPGFRHCHVTASAALRSARVTERARDNIPLADAEADNVESQINPLGMLADTTINNDGTLQDYYRQLVVKIIQMKRTANAR